LVYVFLEGEPTLERSKEECKEKVFTGGKWFSNDS
jgi:hypothetical protein